ncbi:uncharacterized protein MONBRDRAFT_28008 [Monosiga brevicollis MX1]|uniref:Receptor L-domain domain-containing protein n=1 Tax=Monosiga brevicollis TaxID=81824 RepID=A9V6X9_MONBE|nr:uncharacterized protein MONBRDRAFT_28008 [Monosiga brevicollis MX1]EDQ86622.1 predicted protein [Monosiga brevicollis MX1]|eukprot:XP_001748458.1 hypothetical protein [Monosiga brevicollis MX1]
MNPTSAWKRCVAAAIVVAWVVTGAAADCCDSNSLVWTINNAADAETWPAGTTKTLADINIYCTNAGEPLTSLAFMAGLEAIQGYLSIQNCANLTSLTGLESLRVIGGSASRGLVIENNDQLTDLKALEQLEAIEDGGATVRFNAELCYIYLFDWARVVPATDTITVEYEPLRCLTDTYCDASCHCGYCAGPGTCPAQGGCEEDLRWVAIPVVLLFLLFLGLGLCIAYSCKRGYCTCQCHASLRRSLRISPQTSMAFPEKPAAPSAAPGGGVVPVMAGSPRASGPDGNAPVSNPGYVSVRPSVSSLAGSPLYLPPSQQPTFQATSPQPASAAPNYTNNSAVQINPASAAGPVPVIPANSESNNATGASVSPVPGVAPVRWQSPQSSLSVRRAGGTPPSVMHLPRLRGTPAQNRVGLAPAPAAEPQTVTQPNASEQA